LVGLRPRPAQSAKIGRLAALGLAALMIVVAWPAFAAAQGGTVRYSYEKIEVGADEQWGLVPRAARAELGGKLTKSKIFDAFKLLKDEKSGTYGNSSIRIGGKLPNAAKVTVKIDPKMARQGRGLIIMAETVYTMSELGVAEVEFPGHFDGAMKREDVPFYAFTLTLPMWRALDVGTVTHARVRLPDGELIAASQFEKRWKQKDPALQEALFSYLDDSQVYTVRSVLKLLPDLKIDYAQRVTPLLKHSSSSVRTQALSVLEAHRNDEVVLEAVLAMMNSDDKDELARSAAEFLGKAKSDKYNIHRDLYVLENGSVEESTKAVQALAKRKSDKRAVDAVYSHLSEERAEVTEASAEAIDEMGATDKQIAALENEKIDDGLRLTIARTLADSDDTESKHIGLTYVTSNTTGRSAELAIRRLGEIASDEARKTIESFLKASERRKQLSAADVLVERGEAASLDALASAVETSENSRQLEQASYELMVAQPLDQILERTEAGDPVIKRIAYRALGERAVKDGAGAQVFDKLADGAKSGDPAVRGASARAIGVFGDDKALDTLKALADDKNAAVRAGVAYGLGYFDGGQMFDTLAGYLDDPEPEVVAAALAAMEQRKEATKWKEIKALTEADDPHVRANALRAMAQLVSRQDKKGVREVISLLSGSVSDNSRIVQLTAIQQLATFEDDTAATGIAIQLNAEDLSLRVAAIEALGKNGHSSATELVVSVLEDPDPDIRRAAIMAIGELDDAAAEPELEALLEKEEDVDLKKLIERTLRKI
ncbi:MAG: HEAT repeat domain-containing protein, partial [Persicimonas sp.]